MKRFDLDDQGFTLLELILFLVIASIAGTAIFTYSMSTRNSTDLVAVMNTRLELHTAMETLVYTYKEQMTDRTLDLTDFKIFAENAGFPVTVNAELKSKMIQEDDPRMLKITLSKEGQSLWALFTE